MKNFKLIFLAIILIATANSCKKGDDDPFLSLQSRKKRISKEWILMEGNYTHSITFENETHESQYVQTQNSVTRTIGDTTMVADCIETINFNEEGTYSTTNEYENFFGFGKASGKIVGKWEFLSSEGDYKNKERVKLIPESSTAIFMGDTSITDYTESSRTFSHIIQITRLSKKELNFDFEIIGEENGATQETDGSKNFVEK